MKRLIIAAGISMLATGSAIAGGGCINGDHAALDAEQLPPVAANVEDQTDPEYLAWLKAQESTAALEKLIETPVVHN